MAKYIIEETTYNKVFAVIEEQANHWGSRAKDMEEFPERAEKYRERCNEMLGLLKELWELEEVIDLKED